MIDQISIVLDNMPSDWLKLTTHRLDIYQEELAKTEFIEHFQALLDRLPKSDSKGPNDLASTFGELPTAYDYIRLGHPLSCILEWAVAETNKVSAEHVISFSSRTMPLMAILRKNLLDRKETLVLHDGRLNPELDFEVVKRIYGYSFEVRNIEELNEGEDPIMADSIVYIANTKDLTHFDRELFVNERRRVDFLINMSQDLGSIILVDPETAEDTAYISEIQHVRRRESIAMTPANCHKALVQLSGRSASPSQENIDKASNLIVKNTISNITGTEIDAVLGSSGLSVQYAIMMGLVHDAKEEHPGKDIKIIVPPNCYGGTNDQARRVVACIKNAEIVDLLVDDGNDMVQSIDQILERVAAKDAIPYIIAEIPTNPRVEVPDLLKLKEVLGKQRFTTAGKKAIEPVFILDQTFCPNVQFLGAGQILSETRAISYSSGSKFPSGGRCTAGYCVGNTKAARLLEKVALHISLCDNEATHQQVEILAELMPSMNQRIQEAYSNARDFVTFIKDTLPEAKINFVTEELASLGFTPSVFSLDLPSKGETAEESEAHKRSLNKKLIHMMISEIPDESKHCVSYGQLKGCYWTIPATSTQGTTKEGDKDYIARVALSPALDMDLHKRVFSDFVKSLI